MSNNTKQSIFLSTTDPVVAAIDIGYGNTKFTTSRPGQPLMCKMFPSMAVPVTKADTSSGG